MYCLSYTFRDNTICTDKQGHVNNITRTVPCIKQLSWPLFDLSADWEYYILVLASTDEGNSTIGTADPVTTLEARKLFLFSYLICIVIVLGLYIFHLYSLTLLIVTFASQSG